MLPWYVLNHALYARECKELARAYPEMALCESMARQGVIAFHGTLRFPLGRDARPVHVLLKYPAEFPYLPPEIMPLAEVLIDPHEDVTTVAVPRFFSHRHQMASGALCAFERTSSAERSQYTSGRDTLRRCERWLRAVLAGLFPLEIDSAEADLQAHYEPAGDILLGPCVFRDNLPERGTLRACCLREGPLPLYIVERAETCEGSSSDEELLRRINPVIDENESTGSFDTRWHTLKEEPRPLRQLGDLAQILYPGFGSEPMTSFEREYALDRTTREAIDVALRFPARHGEGFQWLFLRVPVREKALPRETVPGMKHAGILLNGGAITEAWRSAKIRILRVHDIRPHALHLRNRNRVPKTTSEMAFALFGAGALGSCCADLLGKAGVRELRIWDPGLIEAGNVVRHTADLRATGLSKMFAVGLHVAMHNPHCQVTSNHISALTAFSNPSDLAGVTAILSTIADDAVELSVNQQAVHGNFSVYYLRALRSGTAARMVRVRPGIDPCLACHALYFEDGHPQAIHIDAAEDEVVTRECGQAVLAASAADLAVIAGMGTRLVLEDVAQCGSVNQWVWTTTGIEGHEGLARPFSFAESRLSPHSRCAICRKSAIRRVELPATIRAAMTQQARQAAPNETGGILVGRQDKDILRVVAMSDAGPNAVCTPERFERDGPYCQRFLERVVTEHGGGIDYVGDWHSHPTSAALPSLRDLESLASIAKDPAYLTDVPIMLIIGLLNRGGVEPDIRATVHPKEGTVQPIPIDSAD